MGQLPTIPKSTTTDSSNVSSNTMKIINDCAQACAAKYPGYTVTVVDSSTGKTEKMFGGWTDDSSSVGFGDYTIHIFTLFILIVVFALVYRYWYNKTITI